MGVFVFFVLFFEGLALQIKSDGCDCLRPHLLWFLCFVWNSAPASHCFCSCWCGSVFDVGMCFEPSALFVFSFFFSPCSFLLTQGNLKWCHWVSTTVCFPTKTYKAKRSSLHKEDHISHMCELKLRLLLCSFFWAVFKMLYSRAEVKAWWVRACVCVCCMWM